MIRYSVVRWGVNGDRGRRQNTGAAQAGDVGAGPKVSTFFRQFCVELRFSQRLGNEQKRLARSAQIGKDGVAKMI